MSDALDHLASFVSRHAGIGDKAKLCALVVEEFALTRDRSVFYSSDFAVRFSSAKSQTSLPNTILSLSSLHKFDDRPFVVCVVTPTTNRLLLANTTLLRKVSHSSHELRINNIRGSFNGSDIAGELDGIQNGPDQLQRLFDIHEVIGFEGNLSRLVEATNNISPTGSQFDISLTASEQILLAPARARGFIGSPDADKLRDDLGARVERFRNEIIVASLIENTNIRGRVIEYLIAGEDEALHASLLASLRSKRVDVLPNLTVAHTLGDYRRDFEQFNTETDVKTKIMVLSSNPKAYNIDKMLEFLATERSVFMFYFVGIGQDAGLRTALVSVFERRLLQGTILLRHWAGRNSRGTTQFDGKVVTSIIEHPDNEIEIERAIGYLSELMAL